MPRKMQTCKRCKVARTRSAVRVCRRCRHGGRARLPTVGMVLDIPADLPPTLPRLLTQRVTVHPFGWRKGVW
jgi:hypothetical protein